MPNKNVNEIIFSYSVKRVKDIYFNINEQLFIPDPTKLIKIELGHRLGFNLLVNQLNFTLRIYLHYDGMDEILVDMQVDNVFEIQNMQQYQVENQLIVLPQLLITSIVSMSLSHGRALLQKNTAGTVFQDVVLPVTNASAVAEHFFAYMFNKESTVIRTDKNNNVINETVVNKKRKTAKAK